MSREFRDDVMRIQSVGPFQRFPVIINEWTVPHLEAREEDDGTVILLLDHRFALDINEETTPGMVISFVAKAIAVAKGYACHPIKDGWLDEDRVSPPSNPRWPWMHMTSGENLEMDE